MWRWANQRRLSGLKYSNISNGIRILLSSSNIREQPYTRPHCTPCLQNTAASVCLLVNSEREDIDFSRVRYLDVGCD